MIEINDIKPIVTISDNSIYLYYAMIIVGVLLCIGIVFLLYQFVRKKEETLEQKYYKYLQNIDFKDSKRAAYDIVKYGKHIAKEERSIRLIEELSEELAFYKYKKEVDTHISEAIRAKFTIFMESVDV